MGDKYVLCPACHLPEIDLIVKKSISAKCMACGWTGDLDNSHRLANYITKNPPDEGGLNLRNTAEEGAGGANWTKRHAVKKNKGWRPRKRKRGDQMKTKVSLQTTTTTRMTKASFQKRRKKMKRRTKKTRKTRKT